MVVFPKDDNVATITVLCEDSLCRRCHLASEQLDLKDEDRSGAQGWVSARSRFCWYDQIRQYQVDMWRKKGP